jgi:hypothetical protein
VWPIQLCSIFPHCVKRHDFRKKKFLAYNVYFDFPYSFETFTILRRNERDMITMYICSHVNYPLFLPECNKASIFRQIVEKYSNVFHENPSSRSPVVTDVQRDVTKPIVASRKFANVPKTGYLKWPKFIILARWLMCTHIQISVYTHTLFFGTVHLLHSGERFSKVVDQFIVCDVINNNYSFTFIGRNYNQIIGGQFLF